MNYQVIPNKKKLEKEKLEKDRQNKIDNRYNFYENASKFVNVGSALQDNFKENTKYWMLFFYVILIIWVFWTANSSPSTFFSQKHLYIMTIVIPLFFILYLFFGNSGMFNSKNTRIAIAVIVVLGILYLLTYYAMPTGIGFQIFAGYGFNILLFLIIIVGLAIIVNVFSNSVKKLTGWSGFIVRFIFFIPCLLSDYLEYLKTEYHNTPSVVFVLFLFEILLLLAYYYIPKMMTNHLKKNSYILQNSPVRLDKVTVLSNNKVFKINPKTILNTTDKSQDTSTLLGNNSNVINTIMDACGNLLNPGASDSYTSNFGLSMWIYTNDKDIGQKVIQDNPNVKVGYDNGISIFKYGNTDVYNVGKPSITYVGNSKWKFNFMIPDKKLPNPDGSIPLKTYQDTYFIMKVPSQRWNNVVFNYYDNKVDLWINGILERNMDLRNNPLTHLPTDVITLGSNNGLMGGICNIQFFDKPMTMTQITQSYNLLYSRNPPVNNL